VDDDRPVAISLVTTVLTYEVPLYYGTEALIAYSTVFYGPKDATCNARSSVCRCAANPIIALPAVLICYGERMVIDRNRAYPGLNMRLKHNEILLKSISSET